MELVYSCSFFKSIETGGNVSKALVSIFMEHNLFFLFVHFNLFFFFTISQFLFGLDCIFLLHFFIW